MPNPLEADEFDKLLEDNLSEDFLQAASRVEEEALRHCTVPSATLHPVVDDDEYDLILSEDISDEVLLACEEAERPAYPTASIALTFLRPNSPSALPYATVIEYDEYDSLFTDDLSDEFVQAYDEAECSGFSAKDKGPASTSPECKEPSLIPRAPTKNDVAPESLVQLTSLKFNEHSCASVPRTPATKTIATRSPISISSWVSLIESSLKLTVF
ncbi:hypothetical protein B0H10DRAFT_2082609 [Mycena sp. CBHHK59/15]|nr:hypothetical protein B0H10DRAFT_2082609 [Mycena sp. CBHHK59/15]